MTDVLIVEDNLADADLAAELLESAGNFTSQWVDRLEAATERLAASHPACVLLDLGLPDSQGLETIRAVRSADPNVAVVVLTGRDDEETGLRALQEGAQDYLVKGSVTAGAMSRAIRHAVERKRLDREKSAFIARAAHELRTPLAVLAGFGETLADNFDRLTREQIDQVLASLKRQGRRARSLINNLLDLSQLEMGGLRVALDILDLEAAVASALDAAPAPEGKRVACDVPAGLTCLADRGRLEQLLVNLLTNAYKYGGDNISVSAEPRGDDVQIAVADDGSGVPRDIQHQLFEPFVRGSNTESREGSGLGLAIAAGLAEHCGGNLTYEDRQPQGARFIVTLRAQDPHAN